MVARRSPGSRHLGLGGDRKDVWTDQTCSCRCTSRQAVELSVRVCVRSAAHRKQPSAATWTDEALPNRDLHGSGGPSRRKQGQGDRPLSPCGRPNMSRGAGPGSFRGKPPRGSACGLRPQGLRPAGARPRPPVTALSSATCSSGRSNSSPSHRGRPTAVQTPVANGPVGVRRKVLTGTETLLESGFDSPKRSTF